MMAILVPMRGTEAAQHVPCIHYRGSINARDIQVGLPRTGSHHEEVGMLFTYDFAGQLRPKPQVRTCRPHASFETLHSAQKLFLSWNNGDEIDLSAKPLRFLVENDLVPPLLRCQCELETRGTASCHEYPLSCGSLFDPCLRLAAHPGVDGAGDRKIGEDRIEAALVAPDTRYSLVNLPSFTFLGKLRVGNERSAPADRVRGARSEDLLRDLRVSQTVGCEDGDPYLLFYPSGQIHVSPRGARRS